jgi:hypothetical protein
LHDPAEEKAHCREYVAAIHKSHSRLSNQRSGQRKIEKGKLRAKLALKWTRPKR